MNQSDAPFPRPGPRRRDRVPRLGLAVPAPALALGSMVIVQLGAALSSRLFARVGPAGTAWLRLAWAAVILTALARPRLRGRPRRDLLAAAVLGVASGGLTVCYFEAIARIPLGVATTIEFLGPLGVAFAGSRRARDLLWAVLAGTGVVLLTDGSAGGLDLVGVGLAAAAAACWAAYIVFTQHVGRVFEGLEGLAVSMAVAAVTAAPLGVAQAAGGLTPGVVAAGAGLALLLPVVPYALELAALRRMSARAFGVLMSLEPAISVLVGLAVLAQALRLLQVAAVALVTVASIGATLGDRGPGPDLAALG